MVVLFIALMLIQIFLNYKPNIKYLFISIISFIIWSLGYYYTSIFQFSGMYIVFLCGLFYIVNHYYFLKSEIGFIALWIGLITLGMFSNSAYTSLVFIILFVMLEYIHSSILKREENKTIIYQNKLIKQQMDEIEIIYMTMRGWRHDYHNHLQAMKGYLNLKQIDEIGNYLNQLETDLASIDTLYHSGNLQIDAILNSKLSIAAAKDINLDINAEVPAKLSVNDIDLCVIIGNLIDNAMESCMKIENPNKRFIRIYIAILKQQLYISITNATDESVEIRTNEYFTTKRGDHGYGIKRVDSLVKKYDGYLKRANEVGVFATEIVLPL